MTVYFRIKLSTGHRCFSFFGSAALPSLSLPEAADSFWETKSWGEAGWGDNPADILSRKRNHLNVKEINPIFSQTVHSGEIEVKKDKIWSREMNSGVCVFEITLALATLSLVTPSNYLEMEKTKDEI